MLLAAVCAHAAIRHDANREMERVLVEKAAEPRWIESTYAQVFGEMEEKCRSKLSAEAPGAQGRAFRSIVERLFPASGRNRVEVLFIDCPLPAVTVGAMIVSGVSWLTRATEDDLWAVAAHELAHRPADFSRRVVIEYHMPGLDAEEKTQLVADMELSADTRALELLKSAGRDPRALLHFLRKASRTDRSAVMRARLDVLKADAVTVARVPSRRPSAAR